MKHLSILVPDGQCGFSTISCIAGASEVFTEANACRRKAGREDQFKLETVGALRDHDVQVRSFFVKPDTVASEVSKTDLIIIPSSLVRTYDTATKGNKVLINWVEAQYKQGAEVASMCTGAFFLASTGLLEDKTCSTHWAVSDRFRDLFPGVKLQTDKLITDEGGLYTNGGAFSFLQLLLYLVEKHYDRQTAIHCSKIFQIDIDRNMQSGFSIFTGHKKHDDEVVLKAQAYIEGNYQEKISFENLSLKYNVGRRNFDRRFIKATGITPLDYLQRVKIEAAKKAFEISRKTVNEVMYDVGYNDTKAFREVFSRITGLSPVDYKTKYNKVRIS
ncbi:MAG: helix-turn-helix domain-containing protein [Williamsia sp.]|nr:helix-turn-helix domain-containing protein [Williamsia sp.]